VKTRREILSIGCALGAAAMLKGVAVAKTSTTSTSAISSDDPLSHVNPEFRDMLQQLLKTSGPQKSLSTATLAAARAAIAPWVKPPLPSPMVEEKMIPGPTGSPEVRVLVVGASPGATKPAVLHIHGGGYVAGSASAEKRNIQDISIAHDCIVVSVDYRLAPETRFSGSVEDNYAALRWLYSHARELGVDATRIAIKGESAGGGHAAMLAIVARDRGEIPICFQVLIYPMLDDRTGSTHRVPQFIGRYVWTEESNRFGWTSLLGVPAGSPKVPVNAVPARVSSVAGLPPAFIGTGSIDLFGQEDIDYAGRLISAGVATELNVVPGGFHGFDVIAPQANLSLQFNEAWNGALRRAFTKS
jgi:acetyl esterase/lipase